MLDINFIRENKELVERGVKNKKANPELVDKAIALDDERKSLQSKVDNLRAKLNKISRGGKPSGEDLNEAKAIKLSIVETEQSLLGVQKNLNDLMYLIPNIPAGDVPVGKDAGENVVIRKWGKVQNFGFTPKDHLELGQNLGIIDVETSSKVSGSRFSYLKGDGALLEFSLIAYALKVLTREGFVPVVPPVMIKPEVFAKMARLDPGQEEERYFLPKDNLYLVGSAEHTLGPMHMGEVLSEKDLPLRYVGFSTSFRREAGSYGRDTRGIFRVHQFDKLEMESFTVKENAAKEQDFIVSLQEKLVRGLGIPHQVVMICTGDMGGPDSRQIDIECFMPGQNKYRETHTADLIGDYQARRLNTAVHRKNGNTEFAYMNDATAFAVGRTIVAILENYQEGDGSVIVPEVLREFVGKEKLSKST